MKKRRSLVMVILVLVVSASIAGGLYYKRVTGSESTDDIIYIEPETAYRTFADILAHETFKNKVVYVDFWFTACPYCAKEFKAMPALKEHFKAEKDLVFLYLGKDRRIPGEKFRWKKMIANKNLTGAHYFMSIDQYRSIWEETVKDPTVTPGFPHFLIVNREGTIIDDDAPWPSDPELITVLKGVLASP
ncbi:TlpA family protein disulfide reductase [Allomuricauda sp. SCSIO 65647]|uniref:TlpA family protein disulfide reductase n=1 Tax=Allomuricauda sp. SCSIO 65647 TaxID=2908843 RepID=UPI001F2049C9|nr:redoxin family protein [Muricauda sp. SCSIO 65647]UJH67541.1 redoxin family protein [Muricauda sp. SCSIO 65647]